MAEMTPSWLTIWELILPLAVILSTAFTIFILTLPTAYSHFHPHSLQDSDFTDSDKQNPPKSGYTFFQNNKSKNDILDLPSSVQILVLGDIGRSPRMQHHALSIARQGGSVNLIGYVESDVHPDVNAHRFISITRLVPSPFQTSNRFLFLLYGPLKVLWQVQTLYHTIGYRTPACKYLLVQNPPSIPTLAVAGMLAFFRNSRLVIDWHNFGYTILALRLGPKHPFVRLSEWYEGLFAKTAKAHFAVTNAMCRVLKQKWGVDALPLHDRPAEHFQPLNIEQRTEFLRTRPELKDQECTLEDRSWRLIVSSTSWTPDEDFCILLDALVLYASARKQSPSLPRILAIITGKGPQQSYYKNLIQQLTQEGKLGDATITTAFLPIEDYARLLGSADLGISLHTSSSGVDLPMKVVDMFGTGLPVAGKKFEAWGELVKEGENGVGFDTAEDLSVLLQRLFGPDERLLTQIRNGAMRERERRWEDEWNPVAGKLFGLK